MRVISKRFASALPEPFAAPALNGLAGHVGLGTTQLVWHRHRGPQTAPLLRGLGWRHSCLCLLGPGGCFGTGKSTSTPPRKRARVGDPGACATQISLVPRFFMRQQSSSRTLSPPSIATQWLVTLLLIALSSTPLAAQTPNQPSPATLITLDQ